MMRLATVAALGLLALPAAATGEVLRQGEFLQDYITCETWMKRETSDAEMHELIGRWAIAFYLARRAFQRASGGLSFRIGGMRG